MGDNSGGFDSQTLPSLPTAGPEEAHQLSLRHGDKSTLCLLIRVYDAVNRIPVFSMPSGSPICCSPSPSHADLESVPWMG